VGSITQWVALELARVKGWGLDGIKITAIGASSGTATAALEAHLVDATVGNATLGYRLARAKRGRLVGTAADFVHHFMAHEMFATTSMVHDHPERIRRFIAGWFAAVAYMRTNRGDAIRIARTATGLSETDEAQEYDRLMRGISADGHFDPRAIRRIGQSFVELGLLDKEPDMAQLYTEEFLSSR
jgi:ABC-type nitrate/sulfonate/bicarbonate transport system substrate-binding protein